MSPSTRFEFDLQGLPEELICLVIEHIDQVRSLQRLSRTCRQLQRLAEPKLYRHHILRNGYEADLLLHSLERLPARGSYIHTLAYPMDADDQQSFELLEKLLMRSTHLKEFSFESPECSTNNFEDEDTWEEMTDLLFQPFQEATNGQLLPSETPLEVAMKPLGMLSKRKAFQITTHGKSFIDDKLQ